MASSRCFLPTSWSTSRNLLTTSIYQRNIPKAYEVGVTVVVVGREVFAAAVDSQVTTATRQDWRRERLPFQAYALPPVVADKCVALVQALQLGFGAIDLIELTDGEYLFFRNQSQRAVGLGGAGLWPADFPCADCGVDHLMRPA